MESSDRQRFEIRCTRVAARARNAGVSIKKVAGAHAITASGHGASATFPIVTDERDWRQTTAEEAFYSVVLDAHAWASARPDGEALGALDATERSELPLIRKDLEEERGRIEKLASIMGGRDALLELLAAAELDPTALA